MPAIGGIGHLAKLLSGDDRQLVLQGTPLYGRLFELSDDLDDAVNIAIELSKILSGNPILGVNRPSNFLNAIAAQVVPIER
jgi:hypothetical protein